MAAAHWPLHYTFIRERVWQQPPLDRCDAKENSQFYSGWIEFSATEYDQPQERSFVLGTLSRHLSANLSAVEYALGDAIEGAQMAAGFWGALAHTLDPWSWRLRPQDAEQLQRLLPLQASLPLVGPNAPFRNLSQQALNEGVGYGMLRFIPAGELQTAALGPRVIVVTDDVPNDIPLVGGLITEAFQTPLAHVNVLSQGRGTPNASLRGARNALEQHLDELVRLTVDAAGVTISAVEASEAEAYWQERSPSAASASPRLDTSVRDLRPLDESGLDDLPSIGAKAAQLAELGRDLDPYCGSLDAVETPRAAFAIPVVHSREHLRASGASDLLEEVQVESGFRSDPLVRARGLERVQRRIWQHPVSPGLLARIHEEVSDRFGDTRVRFRSSSNTEDLSGFNGAGLYASASAQLGDEERRVEDALRIVWASLYGKRAYEERQSSGIDETTVAMGVLVHEAFRDERANGVAVSRNLLDPSRGDIYYVNAQAGEASVTNPAPGVTTDQLVFRWGREPPVLYHGESSLLGALAEPTEHVLAPHEVEDLSCALRAAHQRFRPLLDPRSEDPWFALEVEFKFLGAERRLLIKQVRPHSFGRSSAFSDCREL